MLDSLNPFLPYALLFLRIIVAIIFFSSGLKKVRQPAKSAEKQGLPSFLMFTVGMGEIVAPILIAVGIYVQIGAMILIIVMLGAISMKIFVWGVGFYSSEGYGWHYDLLLLCANLVFLAGGGPLILIG
jgi:putative oxidoreductase